MEAEVVLFLVVNLLSLGHPVLPADIDQLRSRSASDAGGVKIPHPVGTEFETRRKRSSPDVQHGPRLTMSERDGGERLVEPNIAE